MKYILAFSIFINTLYGCAMCALVTPTVNVKVYVTPKGKNTNFDISWKFSKEYIATLKMYDKNQNSILDKNEQIEIQKSLKDYLKTTNYLTYIMYGAKSKKFILDQRQKVVLSSEKFIFKDGAMEYKYSFESDFILQKDYKLYVGFFDKGGFFSFSLNDVVVKDYNDFLEYISFESYIHIYFYDEEDKLSHATQVYDEAQDEVLELGGEVIEEKEEASSFYTSLSKELEKIKKHIQVLLNDIKDTNSFTSYMWLLFFSFVYGVIHAMGPGHGKSLVSAYFLSKNASYIKALNISLLIGVVHTFSAFIITLVIYYVLGIIFLNSAANIEIYATKISAIIIILIAIYLIYKKIPKKQKIVSFSTTKPHASSCSCSGCNTHSTDIGVILAAGIIPCPGTVTIFIFTMSLGVYFVGFLSAVFMSLGMSFIIFISAFASIKLKHQTNSNETLKKVFEYGSLVFILCLGILLLVY